MSSVLENPPFFYIPSEISETHAAKKHVNIKNEGKPGQSGSVD